MFDFNGGQRLDGDVVFGCAGRVFASVNAPGMEATDGMDFVYGVGVGRQICKVIIDGHGVGVLGFRADEKHRTGRRERKCWFG